MPITHDIEVNHISKDEYHQIDHAVMRLAFDIHNELGRMHDEKVYQTDLAVRCAQAGMAVRAEVPVVVAYKTFSKTYYIDLIVNSAVVYETKTVEVIAGHHRGQTLNYVFLLGVQHGKVVNFRPVSVEHEYVTTNIRPDDRFRLVIDDGDWVDADAESAAFKKLMLELIAEWGAFLSVQLFCDAVVFFFGGEDAVMRRVDIVRDGQLLGSDRMDLLNPQTSFIITANVVGQRSYEKHLQRFLRFANVHRAQWVNFHNQNIMFKTIESAQAT